MNSDLNMKKYFLLIFLIATKNVLSNSILPHKKYQISINSIIDTAVYPIANISSINLPFYYNKPINIFLADLADAYPGCILSSIYANDNLRMGTRVNVYYSNHMGFVLIVKNFQYMNSFSPTGNFDINLFRKENIHRIELWNVEDCVHGCK